MSDLVLHPTSTAQWHSLVNEAQTACKVSLNEELESYLVFLLMRFVSRPEMAASVLALQYLEGAASGGRVRDDRMRDVGDQCLLFCGLFPRRAERRRVRVSYFVQLGRSAFNMLAQTATAGAGLYAQVTSGFVPMMDVLQATRAAEPPIGPLAAQELWMDTGSESARQALANATGGTPVSGDTGRH